MCYRYESDECYLYGSKDARCHIQRGPAYPDLALCEAGDACPDRPCPPELVKC